MFYLEEQAQQQVRRIWRAAGAAGVDADLAQVESLHRIEDEVDEMIGGHPVAQIGREQPRRVVIDVDEAWTHADRIDAGLVSFKQSSKNRRGGKSDRLLV